MTEDSEVPAVQPVGLKFRLILALLVGGIYCAFVTLALMQQVPAEYTRPLENWSPDNPRFLSAHTRVGAVPLSRTNSSEGGFVHRLDLVQLANLPLESLHALGFKFDVVLRSPDQGPAHASRVTIKEAWLRNGAQTLELKAGPVVGLQTEDILTFVADPAHWINESISTNWGLSIITAEPVDLRLRCHVTSAAEISSLSTNVGSFAVILGGGHRFAYPHGLATYRDSQPPVRRLDMVAWTWAWERPERVLRWLGVSFLAILVGFTILPIGADPLLGIRSGRIALGTALLFFAFGLGELVLTPPFFGTDEPSHFFSYHRWMGDTQTTDAALVEGRRLHSARLLLRPEQKLAREDQDHPWSWFIDNPLTIDTRPAARSATTARMWETLRPWFVTRTPLSMLFRLRFLSLLTFSIGAGLAAAVLASTVPCNEWSPWLGWTPLLIPSLPYFAMNYSNYPTLFGGFTVLAAAMVSSLVTPHRPWWLGAVMGIATGFVLHTSQSAFPAVAFVLAGLGGIAIGRLFRPESVAVSRFPSFGFWIWLGLGLLAVRVFTTPEFEAESSYRLTQATERVYGQNPLSYLGGVAAVCLGGFLAESLAVWLWGRWSAAVGKYLGLFGYGLAMLGAAGLVWNTIKPAPHLNALREVVPSWEFVPNQRSLLPLVTEPFPADPAPRVKEYDLAAIKAVFGSLGPGDHDFMSSRLFWILGGYLDCMAPEAWISVLSTVFILGLLLLAWDLGRYKDGERVWILLSLLGGLGIYLTLIATASVTATAKPSLHGRYLIGFYLCFLTIGFIGLRRIIAVKSASHPMLVAGLALGIPVAHQLTLIFAQLGRYY